MAQNAAINMVSPVNWAHPLNRGLVGWWLVMPGISSGSRFTDLTNPGNSGNHGALFGMSNTNWLGSSRSGSYGELDFDGNDQWVVIGNPPSLRLESSPFTINVWALDTAGGRAIFTRGVSRGSNVDRSVDLFDNGTIVLFLGSKDSSVIFDVRATRPTLNEPHMLTGTWDGTTNTDGAKLYFDGVLVDSDTSSGATLNADMDWNLGGFRDDGAFEWLGRGDDWSIRNRAWSASEVAQYYNLSRQGYPGLLNRIRTPRFVAAAAGAGIRNPFGGPMVLRNPLGA